MISKNWCISFVKKVLVNFRVKFGTEIYIHKSKLMHNQAREIKYFLTARLSQMVFAPVSPSCFLPARPLF
jgi:hypothetical protein